jgi:hypothetical protein
MKKSSIISVIAVVTFCFTGIAFADNWKGGSDQRGRNNSQQYQRSHRNEKQAYDRRGYREENHRSAVRHNDNDRRHDYRKYRGYSEHPYQKHRRYQHYDHRGHRYGYRGHWRSWDQWHRYAKGHPEIYRHGVYYRDGGHLMFRFLDPVSGGFFFFSIGR